MRKAVLSGAKNSIGLILAEVVKPSGKHNADTIRELAAALAAKGDLKEMNLVFSQWQPQQPDPAPWEFAFAEGLATGLRRSKLSQKTLAALITRPPLELKQFSENFKRLVDKSGELALDRSKSTEVRLAALSLASQKSQDEMFKIVEKLIEQSEPVEIQKAAVASISRFKRTEVAEFFFARWNDLAPTPRREALNLIASSSQSGILLMKKMKAGEIPAAIMPPMQRWSYGRSSNKEIKELATELFGKVDNDRAKVVEDYRKGIAKLTGNPDAGKLVFQKGACITCHKMGDIGVDVGPSLADVRIKPNVALLTDILDPNRAVEERWAAYHIQTKSGQNFAGLVAAETDNTVQIKVPGGHSESIPRNQIAKTTSPGLSLMPVGLEAAISKQEMADLLAFLKK